MEELPAACLIITGHAWVHLNHYAVIETESGLQVGGPLCASNKKPRRSQQYQRERYLAHHQNISAGEEPAAPSARDILVLAVLQAGNYIRPREIPGWPQAE